MPVRPCGNSLFRLIYKVSSAALDERLRSTPHTVTDPLTGHTEVT